MACACSSRRLLQAFDFFKQLFFSTRPVAYFIYDLHEFFEWQCGHGANLKGAMGGGQDVPAEKVLDRVLVRYLDDRDEIILS